jgi:hypothetical protein
VTRRMEQMGAGTVKVVAAPLDTDEVPVLSATPRTWPEWCSGKAANAVALACFAFVVVATFVLIHRYAMNVTYYDQWADVALIRRAHDGTLTLGALWGQYNENRILFPNLVVLLVYYTTHYNVVVEDYLSGVAMCGSAAFVVLTHRRRSPGMPVIAYVPVALVLLSAAVTTDALDPFDFSWCLALLAFGATLYIVDRPRLTWLSLAAAIATAVVGSYSTLQGLLIWPAVLVLLWLRRRSWAAIGTWVASMAATTVVYFFHFSLGTNGVFAGRAKGLPAMATFGISEVGNVIGNQEGAHTDFIVGSCVLVVACIALVVGVRKDRAGGAPIGVALLVFGLLFVLVAAKGRTYLGLAAAFRYAPFVLDIWVGSYLVLLSYFSVPASTPKIGGDIDGVSAAGAGWPQRLRQWAGLGFAGLSAAMLLQALVSGSQATVRARGWDGVDQRAANVEANIDGASDQLVTSQLGPPFPATWIRSLTQFERDQRLNLFSTGLAAAEIRGGLDQKLVTSVVLPKRWSSVSGRVLLDANSYAEDRVGLDFLVSGPGFPLQVVAAAIPTVYGNIGYWNTTNVPNGNYRVFSHVRVASGRSYTSTPIVVTVLNRH